MFVSRKRCKLSPSTTFLGAMELSPAEMLDTSERGAVRPFSHCIRSVCSMKWREWCFAILTARIYPTSSGTKN